MDKTFRWGMFWFLISELFLFGLLIGAVIHVRFSITPWLAGQSGDASQLTHYLLWPNFAKHWPLFTPPGSTSSITASSLSFIDKLPFINLNLLFFSAVFLTRALLYLKKVNYKKCLVTLSTTIFLAIIFLISQVYYFLHIIKLDLITKTGIYASFIILFLGLHLLNSLAALLFLCILYFRIYKDKLLKKNQFTFDAAVWWWDFLALIGMLGFCFIY